MNYAAISSALGLLAASRRTNPEEPPAGVLVAPFNHFQGFAKTKPMGKT
jgi:hypothetical protein